MRSASARIDDTRQFNYKVRGLTFWEFLPVPHSLRSQGTWTALSCGVASGQSVQPLLPNVTDHRGFDLKNEVAENILTEQGFLKALELTFTVGYLSGRFFYSWL